MSIQEKVRNIIFYYIKNEYNLYLQKNNIKIIEEENLKEIITNMYLNKKKDLQVFIRQCLKEMMKDNYPGPLVENIIYEIFQDQQLAINRVALEIKKYQEYLINNNSQEYEITIPIDHDFGIGLKIDFYENDVIVQNYKRNSDNQILPAEETGKISIGDSLIQINDIKLEGMSTENKINVVKDAIQKDFIKMKFRTFISEINKEIQY